MASLVNNEGKPFQIAGGTTTIGRSKDNNIVIAHSSVSRHHAEIRLENGRFFIRDLGSRNGTWVGSRRITKLQLFNGDLLRFGEAEFLFENRPCQKIQDSSGENPKRRRHFSVNSTAAIVLFFVLGLGATELALRRQLRPQPSAATTARAGDNYPSRSPAIANHLARRGWFFDKRAVSGQDANATAAGQAILQTDREHTADASWISLEPTARMCNQGVLPADSIFCRVAYLGRHAEGKDLDRGPRAIEPADIAAFCAEGAIDLRSPICARNSTIVR